jgi:hypothetical protein
VQIEPNTPRELTGADRGAARAREVIATIGTSLREQWRPVVAPALVLWVLAVAVSTTLLRPYDVLEYQHYAHAALQDPLFHRLPLEYPAPALAVFLLPLLLPFSYSWAFAILAGIAILVLVTGYEGSGLPGWDTRSAGRLIIYLALGSVMVLTGRYDIFATMAAFLSLRCARRDRWSAAWTWSSIGCVLKLFPAVFWPVFLIAEWRRHGRVPLRRLWWIAGSVALLAGVPALLNHGAALNVLHYYLHRPTEDGSLPAGLSVLLDWHGTTWVSTFHSVNVVSGITGGLSMAFELAGAAACLWVWWEQSRGRLSLEAACLATLTFVMLGSKVLSVQYLIWLMPLWALYRLRITWLLAAAANLVIFPYVIAATGLSYLPEHAFAVSLTLTFFARDVLIGVGTCLWLRSVHHADEPAPERAGVVQMA